MDYSSLNNCNFSDLKKMAKDMGLTTKRSKSEYIIDIQLAFKEYESYTRSRRYVFFPKCYESNYDGNPF